MTAVKIIFSHAIGFNTGTFSTMISYRGSTKYADAETGWVNYTFRLYDPSTGRWLSKDPLEEMGGIPLYGFVENNSVNESDPFGLTNDPGDFGWDVYYPNYITGKYVWRIAYLAEMFGVYREKYVADAKGVAELERRGGITKAEGQALRGQLKANAQAKTPPEVDQVLRAVVGDKKYELRKPTGTHNVGKTNERINRTTGSFKLVGRVLIVIALEKEMEKILTSDNPRKQVGNSSAGMLGQIGGGAAGAAMTQALIALPAVGRLIPHPYVKGGVVIIGGAVGSMVGDTLFRGTYEEIYDVYVCEAESSDR